MNIKQELEKHLGHLVSESVFEKCIEAYHCARHGPVGLGGYAALGYIKSFQRVMGDDYEASMYDFFCGKNELWRENQKTPYPIPIQFRVYAKGAVYGILGDL